MIKIIKWADINYDYNHIIILLLLQHINCMQSKLTPDCTQCFSRSNSVFSACQLDELKGMNEVKNCQVFTKGERIFSEGDYPKGIFCIYSGSVKISKIKEDGKEQVVRLVKGGDLLGYRSLLCHEKYQASAIALEDCRVCFFSKEYYMKLVNSNPALTQNTIQQLTGDLLHAENMMIDLIHKSAKSRIAETILMLQKFYGIYENDGCIKTNLKREDIANIAGTTTETSIRVISEFGKEGILKLDGKKIKVNKEAELKKIADNSPI